MIAKLRKKFILVIMLCVMSTISIALGSLFVINYISYKRNVNNFLERELDMYGGFREERLPDKNRREDNDFFHLTCLMISLCSFFQAFVSLWIIADLS